MSLEIKKIGTLEIEASAAHLDTTFYFIQKLSMSIMFIIVLAAILGLFGTGILGKIKKSGPHLQIQYDRFARLQATNIFRITIQRRDIQNTSKIRLAIGLSFFNKISIKNIYPSPIQQEIQDDKIIFSFLASDLQNGANITLIGEPVEFGRLATTIQVISPIEDALQIKQFIYP